MKQIYFDPRTRKEFDKLPKDIQIEFKALIELLEEKGRLDYPEARKIKGENNLFEIRVRIKGQWRCFYTYINTEIISILHFFRKKSQKTPTRNLNTAKQRMKEWI